MGSFLLMNGFKTVIGCCFIAIACLLSGCAQILIPGTMAGAGELYRYSTGNVAKETFYGDMDTVTAAAKTAFKKLDIELTGVEEKTDETVLLGSTPELKITVKLEPVTTKSTRATATATKNHVIKDKPTGEEILTQMELALKAGQKPVRQHSAVYAKNECGRPIQVVIYSLTGPKGHESWNTRGWFFMEPGAKKLLVNTHNYYVYIYAESTTGEKLLWSGESYHNFNGKPYGFFKVDLGDTFTDFTQSFTCD